MTQFNSVISVVFHFCFFSEGLPHLFLSKWCTGQLVVGFFAKPAFIFDIPFRNRICSISNLCILSFLDLIHRKQVIHRGLVTER